MCQIHSEELTAKLKKKCKDKESVKMWKLFYYMQNDKDFIYSPYHDYPYNRRCKEYRMAKSLIEKGSDILLLGKTYNIGFHCFDSLKLAKNVIDHPLTEDSSLIIVEINVKPKDIISKGPLYNFIDTDFEQKNPSTVISAFSIPEKEWKKIEKCSSRFEIVV